MNKFGKDFVVKELNLSNSRKKRNNSLASHDLSRLRPSNVDQIGIRYYANVSTHVNLCIQRAVSKKCEK